MNMKKIIIILIVLFLTNIFTAYFFNTYYLQIPWVISFRPLIVPRKTQIRQETPKISQKQVPTPTINPQFEEAFDVVWMNESNRGNDKSGLNGYCLAKNMLNEIGFAVYEKYCFKDRQEQKETFMLWLQNRLNHKKMPYCNTIKECILFYTNSAYTI